VVESMDRAWTPAEVWEGYDPTEEPLDEEVLREWTEDGVRYRELYFTGETWEGHPVRAYAMYAAPVGGQELPGVLHIHGGGQTVNPQWLSFWADRGYAAMSFNWGGEWPNRERITLWGPLVQGNHQQSNHNLVSPTPRVNSWYHWTLVSRRALTCLERQAEVDPDRLGVFGTSMGGTIMWNLALDRRIRAGCAVYGVGWDTYREQPKFATGLPKPEANPGTLRWRSSIAPEAYAPLVRFPMLFMSATNDHHGNMDRAYDTLALMPEGVPRRQAFTPRCRHHIGADFAEDLPLWMDAWLRHGEPWPETPGTSLAIGADGVPLLTVTPDDPPDVARVEAYYAVENLSAISRNWRAADLRQDGQGLVARLPVMDVGKYVFAFANVHYGNGVCLSSRLEAGIPAELGDARATDAPSLMICDGSDGTGSWVTQSPSTDPIPPIRIPIRRETAPDGRSGFSPFQHCSPLTYQVGDPKWRGPEGARLTFDVFSRERDDFAVALHVRPFLIGFQEYHAKVELKGAGEWERVELSAGQFISTSDASPLADWNSVEMLELRVPEGGWSDERIVFTHFQWVE